LESGSRSEGFIHNPTIVLYTLSKTIAAEEVEERTEDVFVLDVRPTYSYREEHIAGSHNLPIYDQLAGDNFIGLDASLDDLPTDREITVVCFSGSKASKAAAYLRDHGYDAAALAGGITGWTGATTGSVQSTETDVAPAN